MSFNRSSGKKQPNLSGSRASVKSGQTLVSSGTPALDSLFSGGLALGSIFLVGQDEYECYSPYLVKYFLSEGIVHGHKLFVSCAEPEPSHILKNLPSPATDQVLKNSNVSQTANEDDMKIAWRYQTLPAVDPSVNRVGSTSAPLGRDFDLKTLFELSKVEESLPQCYNPMDNEKCIGYEQLLARLQQILKEENHCVSDSSTEKRVLRIALQGIGSPFWGSSKKLPQFLAQLKLLMRDTYATCLISVPLHLLSDTIQNRVLCNCDVGIELESAPNSPVRNEYGGHHGIVHILQLPHRHAVSYQAPSCLDLGFKLKRKQFSIEKLHLPPALNDSPSTQMSCSAGLEKNKLDF